MSEIDHLQEQALLYLSGELSSEQIVEFERLLDENQTAREALAAATEITTLLVTARENSPATVNRVPRGRLLPVEMITTSLALLLVVATSWWGFGVVQSLWQAGELASSNNSQANTALALAWSQTQEDATADEEAAAATPDPLSTSEQLSELPSWLIAAVSASELKSVSPESSGSDDHAPGLDVEDS